MEAVSGGNGLHIDFYYCHVTAIVAVSALKKSPRSRRTVVGLVHILIILVISLTYLPDEDP